MPSRRANFGTMIIQLPHRRARRSPLAKSFPGMGTMLCLMAIVFAGAGCAGEGTTQPHGEPGRTIVAGTVHNQAGTNVKASLSDTTLQTELDADGRFHLVLPMAEAEYLSLRIGSEFTLAWLQPGDSLHVDVDAAEFDESMAYSGNNPDAANFLAAKFLQIEAMSDAVGNPYMEEEAEFLAYTDGKRDQLLKDLQAAQVPTAFRASEEREIKLEWASERAVYPSYHRYYADAPDYSPGEGYWAFVEDVDLDNDANIQSDNFSLFAESYLNEVAATSLADEEAGRSEKALKRMDLIGERFENPAVRDHLLGKTVMNYMRYDGADGADVLMAKLRASGGKPETIEAAEEAYNGWMAIAEGEPAPDFHGTTLDGQRVALSELKGRVVYVDVWATWCGPCRGEIPFLQELEADFEGDSRVAFVSISVDEDNEAWRTMVTEDELGGIQILAPAAWDSEVVTEYRIAGIPRFMLIDANGTIVSATAERPSSGTIGETIRGLLDAQTAFRVPFLPDGC